MIHAVPIALVAHDDAVIHRIEHDDLFGQPQDEAHVADVCPCGALG